jgi:SAM-dependent methyltransferase
MIGRKSGRDNRRELEETLAFWNRVAADWDVQVGDDGDANRILNSDPVLWRFAGDVSGLDVLDAECGTGYLSRKLQQRGAQVVGVDFSPAMIEIAHDKAPHLDFRVDSCSELATIPDESIDLVVANYVLMDTPDLDGAMLAFNRVLRANGCAVLVFSHPCFPAARARSVGEAIEYVWSFPYFESERCVDPPWNHFKSEFIWFHRPLSDYWRAFRAAGFDVVDFDEPRITSGRCNQAGGEESLRKHRTRPFSVAFKLQKA